MKWEMVTVDPKGAGHTYRLPVPGGWLYRTVSYRYPGLHSLYERLVEKNLTEVISWDTNSKQKAQEIVSQNTVFVAEKKIEPDDMPVALWPVCGTYYEDRIWYR